MIISKCPVCKFTLIKPNIYCEIYGNFFKEECQLCNYIFVFDRNKLISIAHKNVLISKSAFYINDCKFTIINLNSKYINTEEMYNYFNNIFDRKFKKDKLNSYKEICLFIKKINDNLIFE